MTGYEILAERNRAAKAQSFRQIFGIDEYYDSVKSAAPVVAGGIVGVIAGGVHPILGALLGAAFAKNAVEVAIGDASFEEATKQVGRSTFAAVGSMAMPFAPVTGYVIGSIAGNVIIGKTWAAAPSLEEVRAGKAFISKGQKGASVSHVQKVLGLKPDGEFGPETEAAVKAFQESLGIDTSGGVRVGANTLISIDKKKERDATEDRGSNIPNIPKVIPKVFKSADQYDDWGEAKHLPRQTLVHTDRPEGSVKNDGALKTSSEGGFLASLNKPLWEGSSISTWQGGVIGLGIALLLGAGISMAIPKAVS